MMEKRVIALSDSHGCADRLREAAALALSRGRIDALAFLGDGLADFEALQPLFSAESPETALYAVRGNNDGRFRAPGEACFTVNGVRFYACHGHEWHVKSGLERLACAAREREARVALYGHTHRSGLCWEYGVCLMNPGAVCDTASRAIAYAEARVGEDGAVRTDLAKWR